MATSFHERHQELAQAVDIPEEKKVANAALIQVRASDKDRDHRHPDDRSRACRSCLFGMQS